MCGGFKKKKKEWIKKKKKNFFCLNIFNFRALFVIFLWIF